MFIASIWKGKKWHYQGLTSQSQSLGLPYVLYSLSSSELINTFKKRDSPKWKNIYEHDYDHKEIHGRNNIIKSDNDHGLELGIEN